MANETIGQTIVKGIFGLLSNFFSSRNDSFNERLGEIIAENTRLINEINLSKKEREEREIEENNIKNKKIENDTQAFKLCLEESQKKLDEIQIIQEGHDDYEILKKNLLKIIEDIWINALGNKNLDIILKKLCEKLIKELSFENKEINKMNLYILGKTGTGKTTLINQICPSFDGKVGIGKVCTNKTKEYTCKCKNKKHDFISMIDTRGIEINKEFGIQFVKKEAENYINEKLKIGDPNNIVHCFLFTITGTRYEDMEIKLLQELRKIYKEKNIPIIIIYTQCIEDQDYVNDFKEHLNKKLENEITDNPEGIRFIEILAKEKKTRKELYKPYNISKLLIMCYENFKYSCSIAQKRCLIIKVRDKLYKMIEDKAKDVQESSILHDNISDTFIKFFEDIFHLISPFKFEVLILTDLVKNAKDITLSYINKLYDNFTKKYIEEISNKMLDSQIKFFSQNSNVNLGTCIKSKEDWIEKSKNEFNNKIIEDFRIYAFNKIWNKLIPDIIEIFSKVMKEKIILLLEGEECKELFEENSKCKNKILIDKLNLLIKEIHEKEDDSELEIQELTN